MSAIIDFFSKLFDIITSIVDFVVGFFEDVVYVVKTLGDFLLNAPSLFGFLPPAVVALIGVALSVVVIYKVIGRD